MEWQIFNMRMDIYYGECFDKFDKMSAYLFDKENTVKDDF